MENQVEKFNAFREQSWFIVMAWFDLAAKNINGISKSQPAIKPSGR
jgi:hypothetical protein